jgi:hypothetical protein
MLECPRFSKRLQAEIGNRYCKKTYNEIKHTKRLQAEIGNRYCKKTYNEIKH